MPNKDYRWIQKPGGPKYSPAMKRDWADSECRICHRLYRDHTWQEFDACMDEYKAKYMVECKPEK